VAAKRLGVFDPSGRLVEDLADAAERANASLEPVAVAQADSTEYDAVLVAPAVASDLAPPAAGAPLRWIIGDGANAARVAGAAASASATGVLLTPVSGDALFSITHG
jgi:hypothetical protein